MKFSLSKTTVRIPLLYALFGTLWILITDRLLFLLVPTLPQFGLWQTLKGWLFVAVSTIVFYLLLAAAERRQQKVETTQSQSEAKYRLLFDNNPLPMWVYDLETLAFLAVNETAVKTYGYSQSQFLQMTLRDIRSPEDVNQLMADVAQDWPSLNYAGEWRHQHQDGTIFPVEITSHSLTYNGRSARLVIAHDVTEQKKAETALRESEARFRKAIEEAPFPITIHAEDEEILTVNRTWTEMTGYEHSDIPTITDWTEKAYGGRQELVRTDIDRLYGLNQSVSEGEYCITCKDGTQRVWEFSSTPLGALPDGRRCVISIAVDVTERKETENRLRLQSAALEATANAIVITDLNGNLEWANAAFTELTGYAREEALGKNPRDLLRSGQHSREFYKEMWQTILSGEVWHGEIINRRKNGTLYTEEQSITPVQNDEGTITHFIAIKQDISERKQAEKALRESEARYRSLFENKHVVMLVIDHHDGAIVDANPAAATYYGWPRETLEQKKISDLNTLSLDEIQAEMARARREERNYFLFQHQLADGRIRDVEVSSGPIVIEGRSLLFSIVVDITARKEAKAEQERLLTQVQAQAEQLTQIMYSVPEGVCLLDSVGVVLMANPRAEEQLALLAQAEIGDTVAHIGERPLDSLLTSPPQEGSYGVEVNGRIFRIVARPLESGPVAQGWVLVLREVTEQQMVQRQLQQQERLAAIGQLAAGIAHDFNNIMAVIVLYAQLLKNSPNLNEKEQQRLATVNQQANRAAQLIQQILDFSRQAVLEQRPLDLLPLLKEEVKLLQRTLPEHIELEMQYKQDDVFVQADPTRMQQVLMNLALNARDAMPTGGKLLIVLDEIEIQDETQAPLPRMAAGAWIKLTVTDSGAGIEPTVLDHVFEPFFTTKQPGKGAGLGLAQVHGIVGQHGGHITVDSEVGVGTTFTIYLPALKMETAELTDDEEALIPHGHGELVLVVEDNNALREAIVESLTRWEYKVLEAEDGEKALAILQKQNAEIDLIVSDVVMPRLGGARLLKTVHQQGWKIPAILLSGHPLDEAKSSLKQPGVLITLAKPVEMARLAQVIADALSHRPEAG